MSADRWIVIPHWDRWFLYRSDRPPIWIMNYLSLRSNDDYLGLPLAARGLLHGLWIIYAESGGRVRADLKQINRKLSANAKQCHLEALSDAGFVTFSDARPASFRRPIREEKRNLPLPLPEEGEQNLTNGHQPGRRLSAKELRQYTGCRWVRGSHSGSHVHDPLGMDKPPPDWPHEKPSRRDVELALEKTA